MKIKKLMTKATIIAVLLTLISVNNLFAAETVTIKIYGEDYVTEMPQDLGDAQSLIRSMARMLDSADERVVAAERNMSEERTKYLKMINELEGKLYEAEQKAKEANEKLDKIDKDVDRTLKTNTRFTPFLAIGPVIGNDLNAGLHLEFGGMYRVLGNFQIGATLFSSVYNDTSRNFDLGAGAVLAYSIY